MSDEPMPTGADDEEIFSFQAPDPVIGTLVGGRYRIIRRLGEGGMGIVYEAEHEELGRRLAVKIIRPEACWHPAGVDRFLHEARTASRLGHPNLVDVFDMGRLDDGRPYMVMKLLRGQDLEELLRKDGAQSPKRVAELLAGPAAALDAIHSRGLVHRDVKLENIFVETHDGGGESVRLMDFGLAALQHVGSRLTQEGRVLGTPQYLAPELSGGDKAGSSADIYALAVVAYEMIAGRLPFDDDDPIRLLAAKMVQDAPSLSSMSAQDISESLDAFFQRALSREPGRRPKTCKDLVQELAAAVEGKSASGDAEPLPFSFEGDDAKSESKADAKSKARPKSDPLAETAVDAKADKKRERAETLDDESGPAAKASDPPSERKLTDPGIGPSVPPPAAPDVDSETMKSDAKADAKADAEKADAKSEPSGKDTMPDAAAAKSSGDADKPKGQRGHPTPIVPRERLPSDPVEVPASRAPWVLLLIVLLALGVGAWIAFGGEESTPIAENDPDPETTETTESETETETETAMVGETETETETEVEPDVETGMEAETTEVASPTMRTRPGMMRMDSAMEAVVAEMVEMVETMEAEMVAEMEDVPSRVEADRERARSFTAEGNRLSLQGMLPRAIDKYRDATLADPRYAPAWRGLGIANERMNRRPEARRAFERYLQIAPNAADAPRIRERLQGL